MHTLRHPLEKARLRALAELDILDTLPEENYDAIAQLAASICDTPIATVTFIDKDRQWFKAKVGITHCEDPLDISFCIHCVLGEELLEIKDATQDPRFQDNPLVTGGAEIRFYAGIPIFSTTGLPIGSLCVIDTKPRELTELQKETLKTLAAQLSNTLELRLANKYLTIQSQEARVSHQNLKQVFKAIAHDLRSPFQGFLGITQLIEGSYESFTREDILEYIELLGDSAIDTYNLLENLLEWSTHEVSSSTFKPQPHSIAQIVSESIALLETSARKKDVEIGLNLDDTIKVMVDRKMIDSVIRNLSNNAVKFTPEGGRVEISSRKLESTLELSVKDTGVGLSDEQIKKILNHEGIESSNGTTGEKGSGIGLYLVHAFLAQHNTELFIDSVEGKGTTMRFRLALANAELSK